MIWLAAWVTFSCIVVPVCALVRARRQEARHAPQPSVEWGAETPDCDMRANLQSLHVAATGSKSVESKVPVTSI
jgi:hypothetical protein